MKKNYTYSLLLVTLVLSLVSFSWNESIAQHCTLTCIEKLQVSLNLDCEAEINYRMVLIDPDNPYTCSPNGPSAYKVVVMDKDNEPIPSSPKITCDYIGQTLTVKAQHWLTGNNCWSTISIEDKSAPKIECTAINLWCNENAAPVSEGGKAPLPSVKNPCSTDCETLTYTYEDKTEKYECDDEEFKKGNAGKIDRKWTVCDNNNNCSTCTQTILLKTVIFSEISLPSDANISCSELCDINNTSCVGGPTIHGTPINTGFCNIHVSYEDSRQLESCEGTAKIKRIWSIVNPCTNERLEHEQTINIVDTTPPSIICASGAISVTPNPAPASCEAIITVPAATVADDCSSLANITVTTSLYHFKEDGKKELLFTREANGGFAHPVPYGKIGIVYEATDDCGNSISNLKNPCMVEVNDDLSPTPVCNASTKITLGANGIGVIYAQSFDNGSYDNCCIESRQVRRMDQENSAFADYVEFACVDGGGAIMVVLRITDCSGNFAECMVEVIVDDKNPPVITTCPAGLSIDCKDNITPAQINETLLGTPTFEDACGSANITYSFAIKNDFQNTCGLGAVIYEWTVSDAAGNKATCEQIVSFGDNTSFSASNVVFPLNFRSTECYGMRDLVPALTGMPVVSGADCEQIEVTHEDFRITDGAVCVKVERRWMVINVCAPQPSAADTLRHTQIIEVEDNTAPFITCGTGVDVCIDNDACSVAVDVAGISVQQDCGTEIDARIEWTFTPEASCLGEPISGTVQNGFAGFTSPKFGPGVLMVTFYVADECGNESTCNRAYTIKDCKAPNVACHSGIVLPLEVGGTAVFWAKDFDSKSVDNCKTCNNGNLFFSFSQNPGDSSKLFTCQDLGEQPVTIYVADVAGNKTFCETTVIIQSPDNTCDNSNGTTTGGTTTGGTTTGGTATGGTTTGGTTTGGTTTGGTATGGTTTGGTTTGGTTTGGTTTGGTTTGGTTTGGTTTGGTTTGGTTTGGTATGGTATGGTTTGGTATGGTTTGGTTTGGTATGGTTTGGTTTGGTTTGGTISLVVFPEDYIAVTCGTAEELLPTNTGMPEVNITSCAQITVDYVDTRMFSVDACFRIVRTWRVIDECIYTPAIGIGLFEHEQMITIIDSDAPKVFSLEEPCGSTNEVCITGNACTTTVNVTGIQVEDCSENIIVTADWNFTPNANCRGEAMFGQVSGAIDGFTSPSFGPGTLAIKFNISDGCGNATVCERTYIIKDCEAPVPNCLNGLTLGLGQDGTVEFWAKDFDLNTVDNCTDCGPSQLYYSFTESLGDSSFVFNCEDVGIQTAEIFVTDVAGNKSSCVISFTVTPVAICGERRMATVDGAIYTEAGKELESVTVMLEDMEQHVQNMDATTATGNFSFEAPMNSDYMLKPEKDDDLLNGITTFDIILLRKHILGKDLLTSPYQLIAADINNSGSITTLDLVILRKTILNLQDNFPNNTSWRFVKAGHEFSTDPLKADMPQEVVLKELSEDMSVDFVGIKVGDINGSAKTSSLQQAETRSKAIYPINITDRALKQGQSYDLTFSSEAALPTGMQFTIDWKTDYLSLDKVIENEFSRSENIGLRHIDRGLLTYSWDKQTAGANDFEYTIRIRAKQDGLLSELLNISSTLTPAEAYTVDGQTLAVQLNFTPPIAFEVLQNTPNPFAQSTLIPFVLPAQSAAKLVVMNTSGAVLKVVEGEFEKGYNQISLEDLNASGVLYYRLETAFGTVTKKMVQVK